MPTTSNMSLVLPTEGGSDDTWDTILNAAFTLIDSHDHTTGKGVKIVSSALRINADVSWSYSGTNYGITDIAVVDFAAVTAASVASYTGALFVNSSDSNNLYFRTISGSNVKITDGTTLNVSIVGGIGGDYSSISALLDYDDASDTYRFRQETSAAVRQYAKISSADIIIREYDAAGDATVPTETVTIKSPDALAASYSLTLLAALPAATYAMQCSSAGVLSSSNTFTGNLTAADFLHQGRTRVFPGATSVDSNGSHTKKLSALGVQVGWTLGASTNEIIFPLVMDDGDIITGYSLRLTKNTANPNTITSRLYYTQSDTNTENAVGAGDSDATNAPGSVELTETGLSITCGNGGDDEQYYLVVTPGGGVAPAADVVYSLHVFYKRAA